MVSSRVANKGGVFKSSVMLHDQSDKERFSKFRVGHGTDDPSPAKEFLLYYENWDSSVNERLRVR
jgi:hypothetical protein